MMKEMSKFFFSSRALTLWVVMFVAASQPTSQMAWGLGLGVYFGGVIERFLREEKEFREHKSKEV